METSTKMDTHGRWKWINKAAQKFIRYDLPVNSNLAIVTFSNDSKVEHSMVQVHSDQVSKIFVFVFLFSCFFLFNCFKFILNRSVRSRGLWFLGCKVYCSILSTDTYQFLIVVMSLLPPM